MLTDTQVRCYRDQGFCIAPGFLEKSLVDELLNELDEVTAGSTVAHHDGTRMEMEPDQGRQGTRARRVYEPYDHYHTYKNPAESRLPAEISQR
jgi:hypothetical protein